MRFCIVFLYVKSVIQMGFKQHLNNTFSVLFASFL
nr:MAG TPA: UBA-like domain protein [Caudoviricetes sp.]